jgi:hypothetical protein
LFALVDLRWTGLFRQDLAAVLDSAFASSPTGSGAEFSIAQTVEKKAQSWPGFYLKDFQDFRQIDFS